MILYKTDTCEKFIFGVENVHSKNLCVSCLNQKVFL